MDEELIQTEVDDSQALILQAENIKVITCADDYHKVVNHRALIRDMVKKITANKKPGVDSAKQHYELLRDQLNDELQPLKTQDQLLGGKLVAYDTEQARIKRQREIEEERKRREKEAEDRRLAEMARKMGDAKLAQEIEINASEDALSQAPVMFQKETPSAKETGVSFREDWVNFFVEDFEKLPGEYKLPNEVAIRKVVRALKDKCNIPGVKVLAPNKIPIQKS